MIKESDGIIHQIDSLLLMSCVYMFAKILLMYIYLICFNIYTPSSVQYKDLECKQFLHELIPGNFPLLHPKFNPDLYACMQFQ